VQNRSMDDLIKMLSELGTVNVIFVICAAVFAMSWILLPFLVFAIQRSINKCGRELRSFNRKMDLIISRILFEYKEPKDLSSLDTINQKTTDGQVS
jgi:ABC-type molybdate transport system permease subunit